MSLLPGYVFRDLTDVEKATRRSKLDWAGYNLIISQAFVLLSVYLIRRLVPNRKRIPLEWRLSKPISARYPILRSPGDWLVVLSWSAWCFFLAIRGTGDDYLHITKSFGLIGIANFPLHLLLSAKRTPLPISSCYTSNTNFLHRSLGRLITILLSLHSLLYLAFFASTSRLDTRFLESDVQCGFWSFLLLITISLSAFRTLRHCFYKLFITLHITLPALLFPTLWFHTHHLRPYLGSAITIWILDYTLRYTERTQGTVTVAPISDDLIRLTFNPTGSSRPRLYPGSHVRLNIPSLSSIIHTPLSTITVPTSPDSPIELIMRVRAGATKALSLLPRSSPVPADLQGPYGVNLIRKIINREFDKILIITGGVGGTFGVSIAAGMISALQEAGEGMDAVAERIKWVWAARGVKDVSWALEEREEVAEVVEAYITGGAAAGRKKKQKKKQQQQSWNEAVVGEEGVELLEADRGEDEDEEEEKKQGEEEGDVENLKRLGVAGERVHRGSRPEVGGLVAQAVEEAGVDGSTMVVVCGPVEMGVRAKRAVAEWGARGRDIDIHVEEFGY